MISSTEGKTSGATSATQEGRHHDARGNGCLPSLTGDFKVLPTSYINLLFPPPLPTFFFFFITLTNKQLQTTFTNNQPNQPAQPTIKMDTIKNAANYVSESVQQAGATASKETNKQVAKDDNVSIGNRASAAKDAVSDKVDEQKHDFKGEGYKESAKH
ncbi:Glucose-repressible protein [Colletotrichum higginsianum IMI 349063]|uniref:Glucose-repressible protein n=1 Tax=Colletotrichum higginsianum (strain IMI 349063) TaxID=759273 RepID=A0A1B7YJ38_COLHI|nr:Glucose-repressible protein [Colletotrichum higginsianum IMI 349063]OBR12056.1 Glucose-repressible protein [Colletotrichum higginsianum IMI 349063]